MPSCRLSIDTGNGDTPINPEFVNDT